MDRGIKKWIPFDSCYSSLKVVTEIKHEKEKVSYPTLSDDQLNNISNEILKAYELKYTIEIKYFYNDAIYKIKGKISGINFTNKKILIENKYIYLNQILEVN